MASDPGDDNVVAFPGGAPPEGDTPGGATNVSGMDDLVRRLSASMLNRGVDPRDVIARVTSTVMSLDSVGSDPSP